MTPAPLRLSDLRLACDLLLSKAEAKLGPEVPFGSLGVDEYWSLDPRAAFAITDDPHPQMGTVSDDLESLGEFLARPDGETYLWHDLGHVCGLLGLLVFLDLPEGTD